MVRGGGQAPALRAAERHLEIVRGGGQAPNARGLARNSRPYTAFRKHSLPRPLADAVLYDAGVSPAFAPRW